MKYNAGTDIGQVEGISTNFFDEDDLNVLAMIGNPIGVKVPKCPVHNKTMCLLLTYKFRYPNGNRPKFWGCPEYPACTERVTMHQAEALALDAVLGSWQFRDHMRIKYKKPTTRVIHTSKNLEDNVEKPKKSRKLASQEEVQTVRNLIAVHVALVMKHNIEQDEEATRKIVFDFIRANIKCDIMEDLRNLSSDNAIMAINILNGALSNFEIFAKKE